MPTITFDRRLVIHRGDREIHLLFLGRAHTAGDVIAYVPSERVVATGDLMHGLLPYMGDGFPDEWSATLTADHIRSAHDLEVRSSGGDS
jgi:glyoxylase-like metal-dependent hydrolase (beta-lactamase superfamily II)